MTPDEITEQMKDHFNGEWDEKQRLKRFGVFDRCYCPEPEYNPHPYSNICVACRKPIKKP